MTLAASVKGWVRYGFCPIEITERNWGVDGCPRRVLVATFCGHGDQELFLGEFDNRQELERAARAFRAVVTRTWNRLTK